MGKENIRAFDSFHAVYKTLVWTGYFKLLNKPTNKLIWICHQIYRPVSFLVAIVFNLQHLIFIVQRRDKLDEVFDCLMIEIPQLNLIVKLLTLNLQVSRIGKINRLINDPVFAANCPKDEELLVNNKIEMHRLYKLINMGISISGVFWPASHFVKRYQDKNAVVPSYVPFETDTWGRYTLSVACEVVPLLWIGYGHLAFDCLVSAYYAQAAVQLKIIKYNIENLFDVHKLDPRGTIFQYNDVIDPDLKRRFVRYIQRFERLAWYTKEVNDVFSPAMLFQFFTSSLTLCMVTYRMSCTPVASIPFMFMVVVLTIISIQVFLACYYGSLVQYESQLVVNSLYLSDWLSVSPQFRRLLLIAMLRWSRPLTPTVSGIIPLSLNTFVSILKSAYSLYAVLGTRNM